MIVRKNLILDTDSYKASHWVQYPPGATASSSYLSSRGGRYGTTLFFGLQAALKETLAGAAFTKEDIDEAQKFAFKCSEITIDGVDVPVFKDPVTDSGKRSLSGKLALVFENGKLTTVAGPRKDDLLVPVFENGKILREYTLDEVRANSERELF